MSYLVGEHECKLDDKGRFIFPSALKKQLEGAGDSFVVVRGIEDCLLLYPRVEFNRKADELRGLNEYSEENRRYKRNFYRSAAEMTLDSSSRLLIQKRLLEEVGITGKEIILLGMDDKIEIWSASKFQSDGVTKNTSESEQKLDWNKK